MIIRVRTQSLLDTVKRGAAVFLIAAASGVSLSGCHGALETPEQTLSAYLEAVKKGNLEAAYSLVCSGQKAGQSFEEYQREESDAAKKRRSLAGQFDYRIKWVKIKKEAAVANVEVIALPSDTIMVSAVMILLREAKGWRVFTGSYGGGYSLTPNRIKVNN